MNRPELRKTPSNKTDPRDEAARAAARAAEIRADVGGNLDEGIDEFYVPPNEIPEGWTYEWKRKEVLGREDHSHQLALARMGWEPVAASRHPNMMPASVKSETIERKGMILMERPSQITDELRQIERRRAVAQVRGKEEQLAAAPSGHFDRSNKDASLVKVSKTFSPLEIPKD